jgi:DNA repair protein SbcC/Rad50
LRLEEIRLHNFLSHEESCLDLKAIDAAVFLGPNGSGKTSGIIESLSWGLFGVSRYSDIDAVIRTGQTEAQVEIIFRSYNKRYRVLRKRSIKTKRGKSELEFTMQKNGKWQSNALTGASINATEENIRNFLKMNYKTFLASMVAREGSGGFFAQSDPAERKRLINSMLDLERYQTLAKLANDKASKIDLYAIEKEIEELKLIIANRQSLEEDLFAKKIILQRLDDTLDKLMPRLQALREEKVYLETMIKEAADKISNLDRRLLVLQKQQENIKTNIDLQTDLLRQEKEIRLATRQKEAYETKLQQLQERLENNNLALSNIQKKEKALQKSKERCSGELFTIRKERGDIEKKLGIVDTKLINAREQSSILAKIPCPEEYQVKCPAVSQAREARDRIKGLIEEQKEFSQTISYLEKKETAIADITQAIDKEISEQEDLTKQQEIQIEQIRKEIKDTQVHNYTASKKAALITQLEIALSKTEMLQKELMKNQKEVEAEKNALTIIKKDNQICFDRAEEIKKEIIPMEKKVTDQTQDRDNYKEEMFFIKTRLKQIDDCEKKMEDLIQQSQTQAKEKKLYIILSNAFKTIPILIIEHAKPIIEKEANQILTKISDSGMRVSLPLFKALKTSDKIVEKFDIKVQDHIGERPYEMFSSGEKVRIDLALRIGLSRLLTIRSGTRIGTLILDEGFGPLDQEGIEAFKECLQELRRQKEFELLIAATHIDSMKNIFPSHFLFSKNNGISHVEVFN